MPCFRNAGTSATDDYGYPQSEIINLKSEISCIRTPRSLVTAIVQFIAQGVSLVFSNRRFWPFIWRPMAISAGILAAIMILGYQLIVPWGDRMLAQWGLESWVGGAVLRIGYAIIWWFLAGIVFAAISGLLSSFLWDRLSYEIEREVNPNPPQHRLTTGELVTDTLTRGIFAVGIFFFTCGCFWLPLMGVLLAAWLCLYDYTASAYIRRGILFPTQARRAFGVRGSATFGVVSGLLTVIPLVNVLMLPGLVAGGTLMLAEHERRTSALQ